MNFPFEATPERLKQTYAYVIKYERYKLRVATSVV